MDPQELQTVSWRGAFFIVTNATVTGGRRIIKKLFPNSDRQITEDLGLQPDEFSFSGTVAARRDKSGAIIQPYRQVRDALIQAIKLKGPGILVHPTLGRIDNAVLIRYTLRETMTRLGDASIDLTFTTDDGSAVPQISESVVGSVQADSQSLIDRLVEGFEDNFNVTVSFIGNFTHAEDMVESLADTVGPAINSTVSNVGDLGELFEDIDELTSNTAELVLDPLALGRKIADILGGILEVDDPQEAFDTLLKLFEFGDGFTSIFPSTVGLIERQQNQSTFTGTIQSGSLGQAYLSASELDLNTTEDVDRVSSELENQYQKVVTSNALDADSKDALTRLRNTTKKFFDQQRDLRPDVIEVQTQLTTPRLLAHQYYGNDELGRTIGLLNGLDFPTIKAGRAKILSR